MEREAHKLTPLNDADEEAAAIVGITISSEREVIEMNYPKADGFAWE